MPYCHHGGACEAVIYAITNVVNGRRYIGQTACVQQRWGQHRADLYANRHHNIHLQRAWNRYGADAFEFSILERVEDLALLNEREQHYTDLLGSPYSIRVQPHTNRGIRRSEEVRARLRHSRQQHPRIVSDETRAKMSATRKGRKLSPKQVELLRARALIQMSDPANRAKVGAPKRGKPRPQHVIEKVRVALLGRPLSQAHRDTLRIPMTGKKLPQCANPGERNGNHKLTWEQVREIRQRYAQGERQTALAREYGVAQGIISSIVRHETWRE